MQEIHIKVESFEDIRSVSNLAAVEEFGIDLTDGNRTVDARSLMCILSLDLAQPLRLRLHCDQVEAEAFCQKAERFLM